MDDENIESICLSTENSNEERIQALNEFKESEPNKALVLNYPLNVGLDFGSDCNIFISFDSGIPHRNDSIIFREYWHKYGVLNKSKTPGFCVNFINKNDTDMIEKLQNFYSIKMYQLRP